MAMRIIRRQLPIAITFLTGMIFLSEWFVTGTVLTSFTTGLSNFVQSVHVFVFAFAAINLTIVHVGRIRRQLRAERRDLTEMLLSGYLLVLMYLVGLVGAYYGHVRMKIPSAVPEYLWWFNNWELPCEATAYAGTLFFVLAAMYRVFKIRSRETAVLVISGIIAMLGTTPLIASSWQGFFQLGEWLDRTIVTAANRAIMIGIGIGTILMGIRTLLAMETGYLGAKEE